MNVESRSRKPNAAPFSLTITAILVLILFVSWLGWRNLASNDSGSKVSAADVSKQSTLRALAHKCHGHFENLSAQDQQTANDLTQNQGVMAITMLK